MLQMFCMGLNVRLVAWFYLVYPILHAAERWAVSNTNIITH